MLQKCYSRGKESTTRAGPFLFKPPTQKPATHKPATPYIMPQSSRRPFSTVSTSSSTPQPSSSTSFFTDDSSLGPERSKGRANTFVRKKVLLNFRHFPRETSRVHEFLRREQKEILSSWFGRLQHPSAVGLVYTLYREEKSR